MGPEGDAAFSRPRRAAAGGAGAPHAAVWGTVVGHGPTIGLGARLAVVRRGMGQHRELGACLAPPLARRTQWLSIDSGCSSSSQSLL
jgi:hypothetical protein